MTAFYKGLVLLIVLFLTAGGILAVSCSENSRGESSDVTASGTEGNLGWSLTGSGTLTISGEGAMDDHTASTCSSVGWYGYVSQIKKIIVEDGVTSIGAYAFYQTQSENPRYAITDIQLSESVSGIGDHAFENMYSLKTIAGAGVLSIGVYAFSYCSHLRTAFFPFASSIGSSAFSNCINIEEITLAGYSTVLPGSYSFTAAVVDTLIVGSYDTGSGGTGNLLSHNVNSILAWKLPNMFSGMTLNRIVIDTSDTILIVAVSPWAGKEFVLTDKAVSTTGNTLYACDGTTILTDSDRAGHTYTAQSVNGALLWVAVSDDSSGDTADTDDNGDGSGDAEDSEDGPGAFSFNLVAVIFVLAVLAVGAMWLLGGGKR